MLIAFHCIYTNGMFICIVPPPVITSHPMDMTVNNGSNVTFNCVSFSFAQVNYTWFKNGFMLSDDINIIISTNNDEDNDIYTTALMILDVQLSDNGVYVCNAKNSEHTTMSNAATLSVIGKVPAIAWVVYQ